MWDKPHALGRLTHWLVLVTVIYAVLVTGRGLSDELLPFKRVDVLGAKHAETQAGARAIVRGLDGTFFNLDLDAARRQFEAMPWVKSASVRKLWPDRLVVEVEEHVPAASWNGVAMLSTHGEVFPVRPLPGLPRIYAPDGMEHEVARRYGEFILALTPMGLKLAGMQVSPRHAWRLQVEGGLVVELGRERLAERMQRFVATYPRVVAQAGAVSKVDLRYPNGFAISPGKGRDAAPAGNDKSKA